MNGLGWAVVVVIGALWVVGLILTSPPYDRRHPEDWQR